MLVLKLKTMSQVVPDSSPRPIHIQLLRQVMGVQTQSNSLKVLKNVLLAAFSLAWMSNSAISLSSLKRSTNTGSSVAANWDPDSEMLVGAEGWVLKLRRVVKQTNTYIFQHKQSWIESVKRSFQGILRSCPSTTPTPVCHNDTINSSDTNILNEHSR